MKDDNEFQELKNPTHGKEKRIPRMMAKNISLRQPYSKPREQLINIRADQKTPG